MDDFPDSIEWPGQGVAKRLQPRGMSDYSRDQGNAQYRTSLGGTIKYTRQTVNHNGEWITKGFWTAQYKGCTTKRKETVQEAVSSINEMIAKGDIK